MIPGLVSRLLFTKETPRISWLRAGRACLVFRVWRL